jgi:hypothetical protein
MIPSHFPEEVLTMLSKTRGMPVYSPAPGVIPDTITGPASNGSAVATERDVAPAQASAANDREMKRATAAFHWRTRRPRRQGGARS